ncbi:hypothetical protein BH10ACT7_BH10ACT7_25110 [soil metagenome]
MRRAVLGVVLLVALAGCSQIAAIAPVGGDRLAEVRFAANDILIAQGVDVLTAPVCAEAENGDVSCTGETLGGDTIEVSSTDADQNLMTVTVGAREIYSGTIEDALNDALRPAP